VKAFITGANGFLGLRLIQFLHESKDFEIRGLARDPQKCKPLLDLKIEVIKGDLSDPNFLTEAMKGCEVVFHVAALSSPWGKYDDFYKTNVLGTRNVVSACQKAKIKRLIHTSSPSIYINGQDQFDIKEDFPLPKKFINFYAETKYLAELEVQKGISNGLSAIILRPQALIGKNDLTIIPRLIAANKKTGIPLFNEGNCLIDLTHVLNVVKAHVLASKASEEFNGNAYNICNGTPLKMYDLLNNLFKKLEMPFQTKRVPFHLAYFIAKLTEQFYQLFLPHKEPPLTRYGLTVLSCSRTLCIEAAKRDLKYNPDQHTVEDAVEEFCHWWREYDSKN